MIIRATQYLYRLSGVPSIKNTEAPPSPFPGEWYANFVERYDGRYNAIHFLHNPTRISMPKLTTTFQCRKFQGKSIWTGLFAENLPTNLLYHIPVIKTILLS